MRAVVRKFHTGEKRRDEVVVGRVDAVFNLTIGHPGQVARFAMEGIMRNFGSWWDGEPAIGERDVGRCEGGAGERQLQERRFHGGRLADFDAIKMRELMVCCHCFGFISSIRLIDPFPTDKFDNVDMRVVQAELLGAW